MRELSSHLNMAMKGAKVSMWRNCDIKERSSKGKDVAHIQRHRRYEAAREIDYCFV